MEYHQADVLEFWDQPVTFKLEYKNRNNRNISAMHTPDFFVICKTHAEFIECKTEEELIKLSNANPYRYFLGKDKQWRCPPGERYASRFGFRYRVVSSAEIDCTHTRNTVFLEDYLGEDTPPVASERREVIVSLVANEPGILLADLLERIIAAGSTADDVYTLTAQGIIFVNLRAEPLAEPQRVWVYPDNESAQNNTGQKTHLLEPKGKFIEIKEGVRVLLNDSVLSIVAVGTTKIYFEGENGAEPCLTFSQFESLVKKGDIQGIRTDSEADPDARWKEIWNDAKDNMKREASRRLKIVLCHLDKRPLPEEARPRTLAAWKARYRAAERAYGNGIVGLLPGWNMRGNRKERLNPNARKIMLDAIENKYETIEQKGMYIVWGDVVIDCKSSSIKHPSYMTFVRYVKGRPRYLQMLKRMGHRAAYATKPFYYWLDLDTPRHGDRPFEICHIDHTELDIELIDPSDGESCGRPWATFMVDAFSRRNLAIYVTYDPPSYRSNMMVIRECVRRTGRLPQTIVVDGGGDFHGTYFETLAAAFEITIKTRPGAEPRFGSVIERLFNTANKQFVHNLIGNTQITRSVRLTTKDNDPKRLAVWSLGPFYDALCDWAYNRYDTEEHWTLKQSPRDAYASALRLTGLRRHRLIRYDEEFKILTMPTTEKGTAKNISGRGVKINNEYYWCDELDQAEFEGQGLPVRYDPFNYGVAYIYLKDKWVKCFTHARRELEGRTEREQRIMSAEKRMRDRQYSRHLADRAVQRALNHRADQERERGQAEQLRLLRKKQAENTLVLKAIDGSLRESSEHTELGTEVVTERQLRKADSEPSASLFSDIDLGSLGSLEAYKA
jgi:putative transposase